MHLREPSQLNMLQLEQPPCPKCGGPTVLASIEPAPETNQDLRSFACEACGAIDVIRLRFK
jgi:hypothetical protein